MVLDVTLLKIKHYKVRVEGKMKQSKERSSAILDKSVGWLVGFYGISTFVGYLTPNSFLYK